MLRPYFVQNKCPSYKELEPSLTENQQCPTGAATSLGTSEIIERSILALTNVVPLFLFLSILYLLNNVAGNVETKRRELERKSFFCLILFVLL
jgi:hypothetical protein